MVYGRLAVNLQVDAFGVCIVVRAHLLTSYRHSLGMIIAESLICTHSFTDHRLHATHT